MGKFCAKCGNEMDKDATFCANCGQPVKGETKVEKVKVEKVEVESNNVPVSNGMAIAGFILSFFVPVLGLIFSIIGLKKSNQMNGAGRGLAKAGLILSIIWLALKVIILVLYLALYYFAIIAFLVGASYY